MIKVKVVADGHLLKGGEFEVISESKYQFQIKFDSGAVTTVFREDCKVIK